MEIFLSAVLGELASRSINLLISRRSARPTALDVGDSLQSALFRAQVIVDEAMGRHIANQAMLQQLDMLRDAMHRACYVLDTSRCQSHDEEDAEDQVVNHSLSLQKLTSLKGISFASNRKTPPLLEQLQESLQNLSSMILDARELVVFFRSYPPRLYSQPYSMHLLLGNCMFGFQMETELVINFLLHAEPPPGSEELDVLPIIGPSKVGKTTLVAHVCRNQRVRDHFSGILLLHDHDFADDGDDDISTTFGQRCATKLQLRMPDSNKDGRLLVVVDLVGDLGEAAWNVLYSTCKQRSMASRSKIILTSRSDKIVKFGTRPALRLSYVSSEAFWYFFKTITFGSTDPKVHPRLLHLAMDIAKMLDRSLIGANITACLLRENFDVHYWSKVRTFLRGLVQKHISKFGVHPAHLLEQDRPLQVGRMATTLEDLVFFYECQRSSQEEVPEMRFQDVMYGNVKAVGKFKALGWRSQIPPYYSYVISCQIIGQETARATKRKRSVRNRTNSFA